MSSNTDTPISDIAELADTSKPQKALKSPKRRRSRAGLRIKKPNLDQVHRKLLAILVRDTNHLLEASLKAKLNRDESNSLTSYLKSAISELKALKRDRRDRQQTN